MSGQDRDPIFFSISKDPRENRRYSKPGTSEPAKRPSVGYPQTPQTPSVTEPVTGFDGRDLLAGYLGLII